MAASILWPRSFWLVRTDWLIQSRGFCMRPSYCLTDLADLLRDSDLSLFITNCVQVKMRPCWGIDANMNILDVCEVLQYCYVIWLRNHWFSRRSRNSESRSILCLLSQCGISAEFMWDTCAGFMRNSCGILRDPESINRGEIS